MTKTPSSMIPLGSIAPDFSLVDVKSGCIINLQAVKSKIATVIMFICNHCPYVKYIENELIKVANHYQEKGIVFIAINSNDTVAYPDDAPEKMRELALKNHYPFPYLFDDSQDVAKAYHAACTPDFYIFDSALKCVYRGRFDNSMPSNNIMPSGNDIRSALNQLLTQQEISKDQYPSMGCNIKWKNN